LPSPDAPTHPVACLRGLSGGPTRYGGQRLGSFRAVVFTTGRARFGTFWDVSAERQEMRKPHKIRGFLVFSRVVGRSVIALAKRCYRPLSHLSKAILSSHLHLFSIPVSNSLQPPFPSQKWSGCGPGDLFEERCPVRQ